MIIKLINAWKTVLKKIMDLWRLVQKKLNARVSENYGLEANWYDF